MVQNLLSSIESSVQITPGAVLLERYALPSEVEILAAINQVAEAAAFRFMIVPNGRRMSVAMTNCGKVGWISNRSGYRYEPNDPETGKPWPAMPQPLMALAQSAAHEAGYEGFTPDACLINRYEPGAKMGLHKDADEVDFDAPIVSVSLGLSATFLFGGLNPQARTKKIPLHHGDAIVFGGESRLAYHGIAPLKEGEHPLVGRQRINLTFRKAL